jgi:drug/metabolite transporter (DMT)-like permease
MTAPTAPPPPAVPTRRARDLAPAVAAAALFGMSTPLAKLLLRDTAPQALAGLLYLGAGLGLAAQVAVSRSPLAPRPTRADLPWLLGTVTVGGALAPVLLMTGLRATSGATASLLLNLEGALTAVIAWRVFREPFDRRLVLGMALVLAASGLLSWSGGPLAAGSLHGPALVAAACLGWAVDNNLTRRIDQLDPRLIVIAKGLVAGTVNLALAAAAGQRLPALPATLAALALGLASYGWSLLLFVVALRRLGTARTGAWFALAPFVGAGVSVTLLGERPTVTLGAAAALLAAGLWLHLAERHEHPHRHEPVEHDHAHVHDDGHHDHAHPPGDDVRGPHAHPHRHEAREHSHPHYPDTHHRHGHGPSGVTPSR